MKIMSLPFTALFMGFMFTSCDESRDRDVENLLAASKTGEAVNNGELSVLTKENARLRKDLADMKSLYETSKIGLDTLRRDIADKDLTLLDLESRLLVTKLDLEASQVARPVVQPRQITVQPTSALNYPKSVPTPEPRLKRWIEPNARMAENAIKQAAEKEWGTDYNMVSYEIKRQAEAFEELKAINRNANVTTREIIDKAASEWPTDFSMMLYEVKRQIESYNQINNR